VEAGVAYVQAVNKRITQDILISSEEHGQAKDGQMVIAAITAPTNAALSACRKNH